MNAMIFYTTMQSPIGELLLTSDGKSCTASTCRIRRTQRRRPKIGGATTRRWSELACNCKPISPASCVISTCRWQPPARRSSSASGWRYAISVTARTISYGELALRIGQPAASRAVGLANGQNPIPSSSLATA